MQSKQIIFAAMSVLVLVVAYRMYKMKKDKAAKAGMTARKEGLTTRPQAIVATASAQPSAKRSYPAMALAAPYTAIQNQIGEVRGNPDATAILNQGAEAINAYRRSQAAMTPEDLMHAERALWGAAAEQDRRAPYNTEKMDDVAADTVQHFESSPALDYQTMVTDLVVDPRTKENHMLWVQEMKGWNGTTTMKVDTLEPQLYLNWQGLRMPQAGVGQYNPLQLTEVDDTMLAVNKPFNFNG